MTAISSMEWNATGQWFWIILLEESASNLEMEFEMPVSKLRRKVTGQCAPMDGAHGEQLGD
jgi:hypothetical protein